MDAAVRLQKEPSHVDVESAKNAVAAGEDWPVKGGVFADDHGHLLPRLAAAFDADEAASRRGEMGSTL